MPIYLPAPAHRPGGPDGQGWNRLAIGGLTGAECALKPLSGPKLYESWNTRLAHYGGFGPCGNKGQCTACPVLERLTSEPLELTHHKPDERVLFVERPQGDLWAPLDPAKPDSYGYFYELGELARLKAWQFDGFYHGEHGTGFWLKRSVPWPSKTMRKAA